MLDILKNIPTIDIGEIPAPKLPDREGRREYIVTLHNYEDLDLFYDDMETPGGNLYIPDRAVKVEIRRPNSRNTNYRLTPEEAEQLRGDSRVLSVELTIEESGKVLRPFWTQTSDKFDKSAGLTNDMINWAISRCVKGNINPTWGSDGTPTISDTVTTTTAGKNVDVVIFDGLINATHPEFQRNPEGTGGPRVVLYNWSQHLPEVTGAPAGQYDYNRRQIDDYDEQHGTHVAGTACGNTQGWAREANIYTINPYGLIMDAVTACGCIREFHRNKPVNPLTGRKNPTVVNMSFGASAMVSLGSDVFAVTGNIKRLKQLGTVYDTTSWRLIDWAFPADKTATSSAPITGTGIFVAALTDGSYALYFTIRSPSIEAEMQDMMNEGIICVSAAGNAFSHVENYSIDGNNEYNDYIILSGIYTEETIYTKRGSLSATPNCICVGAASTEVDSRRGNFSGYGPRIDIYAPGVNIMSSFPDGDTSGVSDARSGSFTLGKLGGTSMASPQVTGVIACLLETYPHFSQSDVREYIFGKSTPDMADYGDAYEYPSYTSLHNGPNRYLKYIKEREVSGEVFPKKNMLNRPTKGQTFPRPRIFTTK